MPQVDKRLLRALGHPVRQLVVTLLNERVATAAQISRELGIPEPEVVSHLDVLLENDAIEASDGEPDDDTAYRATIRPFLDEHRIVAGLCAREAARRRPFTVVG